MVNSSLVSRTAPKSTGSTIGWLPAATVPSVSANCIFSAVISNSAPLWSTGTCGCLHEERPEQVPLFAM